MFDYKWWSAWLEAKVPSLQPQGLTAHFHRVDSAPEPSSSLAAMSDNAIGVFSIWETGESRRDITDDRGNSINHSGIMLLTEENFTTAFEDFTVFIL
jgi:hypothetical protein